MFTSTLYTYDLKKGDLFVLSLNRVCIGSVSSVVFIGGGVCAVFCRFARCFVTMVVCIVVKSVFMYRSVMVSGLVLMFVV